MSPRVVVVGPCASGKSTLVSALRQQGIDASVCAQEHSVVQDLFRLHDPDVVIALTLDLDTIRQRRGDQFPSSVYEAQMERLQLAFAEAAVVIDSAVESPVRVFGKALAAIDRADRRAADSGNG